jgi:hypothetical protein
MACAAAFLLSILSWRKNMALLISSAIFAMGAAYFVVVEHYDYGAYKILETGWVPLLLVCGLGTAESKLVMRKVAAIAGIALLSVAVARVVTFYRWVPVKSISQFSGLQFAIPGASVVDVKVENHLAFEWATYYLRNHQAVFSEGELPYFPDARIDKSRDGDRLRKVEYVVTDKPQQQNKTIWSKGVYYVYFTVH